MQDNAAYNTTEFGGFCEEVRSVKGSGEDASLHLRGKKTTVIACMDGCGGSGARKYTALQNKTGAWLASRLCRAAVKLWFEAPENGIMQLGIQDAPPERIAASLKGAIQACLLQGAAFAGGESGVKSRLSKTFPTTLAMALTESRGEESRHIFMWAGDSRGYLLSPGHGLCLVTEDDVEGGFDPLEFSRDGIMSQVIAADGKYDIHAKEINISFPCFLITATDGCFAYLGTPMELEWILLETLFQAGDMAGWAELIKDRIAKSAGDDYSMEICLGGKLTFEQSKQRFVQRKDVLLKRYIQPAEALVAEGDSTALHRLCREYQEETNIYGSST